MAIYSTLIQFSFTSGDTEIISNVYVMHQRPTETNNSENHFAPGTSFRCHTTGARTRVVKPLMRSVKPYALIAINQQQSVNNLRRAWKISPGSQMVGLSISQDLGSVRVIINKISRSIDQVRINPVKRIHVIERLLLNIYQAVGRSLNVLDIID